MLSNSNGAAGKLPNNNGIPWRGDSGLDDGNTTTDVKGGMVGGYYDAGDNTKFNFPMSFAMTMLSWSLIEYDHKYKAIGEYNHAKDLIKWGTDYLLLTFNSSATKINQIHAQVPNLYSFINHTFTILESSNVIIYVFDYYRLVDLKMVLQYQMIITVGKDQKTWTIRDQSKLYLLGLILPEKWLQL